MGGDLTSSSPRDFKKLFDEVWPYYLAWGMTYEMFWQGDPGLVRAYRKARTIRRDEDNFRAWLQGLYIYEALCNVSPILHAFAKAGTKANPYPEQPHPLTDQDIEKREKEDEEKNIQIHKAYLAEFARKFNKTFKEGVKPDEYRSVGTTDNSQLNGSLEVDRQADGITPVP